MVFLSKIGWNIIFMDWSKGADKFFWMPGYKKAASNTRMVGAIASQFLKQDSRFNPDTADCLAFSLGAHVCGFMAKYGHFKWANVWAGDAAGPHFSKPDPIARLDKSDAKFMAAMHTSSEEGIQIPIGHVDLWVF